jgi:hypothetical protein
MMHASGVELEASAYLKDAMRRSAAHYANFTATVNDRSGPAACTYRVTERSGD